MYIYQNSTVKHLIPFAWFVAEGRSLYEVVLLYQKGLISSEFLYADQISKKLHVGLTNFDNWLTTLNDKYHLYLTLAETKGYVRLGMLLDVGDYVATHFRPNINEDILPATWKELFGTEEAPFACPTEDEEYADHVEPDNLDEPVLEEELDEYDLDYTDKMYDDELPPLEEPFDEFQEDDFHEPIPELVVEEKKIE